MSTVTVTLNLDPAVAAGLMRFAQKASYEQAKSVLYGHLNTDLRSQQAGQILQGFEMLTRVLGDAGVASWPWVETGKVS